MTMLLSVLLMGFNLQEEIDKVPQPEGGIVNIPAGRFVYKERISLENKINITVRGYNLDSTMVIFQLNKPDVGFWLKGAIRCKLENMSVMAAYTDPGGERLTNVISTVLICRDDNQNNGKDCQLENIHLLGVPSFSGLFTAGTDLLEIDGLYGSTTLDKTYCWYSCGARIPKELKDLNVKGYHGAVGIWVQNVKLHSRGKDSTTIHLEDIYGLNLSKFFIANFDKYTGGKPQGKACLNFSGIIEMPTLINFHVESNDCKYGMLIDGSVKYMNLIGCRIQARKSIYVTKDGRLYNPDETNWRIRNRLRSLDDGIDTHPISWEK